MTLPSFKQAAALFVALCATTSRPLLCSAQAPAPSSAAENAKPSSNATLLDVTVNDSKGQPIHGIPQADFAIKLDGKVIPIAGFHEVDAKEANAPVANLLLLNSMGFSAEDQKTVKQIATTYIKGKPEKTEVGVFELSDNGLRPLQKFTADPTTLQAVVDAESAPDAGSARRSDASQCAATDRRNLMTLTSLGSIAKGFSRMEGRKNLIWFVNAGYPTITDHIARDGYNEKHIGHADHCLSDYHADLAKAFELLASARIAIYPICVNPIPATADMDSLDVFAQATGGEVYFKYDKDPVAKAINSGSSYYTLSYAPPGDDAAQKKHKVTVEVHHSGARVSYRKDFDTGKK